MAQEATTGSRLRDPGGYIAPVADTTPTLQGLANEMQADSARLDTLVSYVRKLEVNETDTKQFEAYLKVDQYADALGIVQDGDEVDLSKLPASYRKNLGVESLSKYSRRLISSIINEVMPKSVGGAGHESMKVERITKDHRGEGNRTSTEVIPPLDDEPRESQHYLENGKAVDVSELDTLRGTEFTIKIKVDSDGNPILKDGKQQGEVVKVKRLPTEGIQFVWQDEETAGKFPGALPSIYGETPHHAAQTLSENQLGQVIADELGKRGSSEIDLSRINLSGVQNLGELARTIAQSKLQYAAGGAELDLGPNGAFWTGQAILEQATGLPSYGWFGETLDGASDGQTGLLINLGREVVGQKLGLAQGALIGSNSTDIFRNVGQRTFEMALGELPLGTLAGISSGDRGDLERHVGAGVLAKQLDLYVKQVPLGASTDEFRAALGVQWAGLEHESVAYDTSFNLHGTQATSSMASGQTSPDEYLRKIGAERLRMLEVYSAPDGSKSRRDAALNLEERPNLVSGLKDLPISPDPSTTGLTGLSAAERQAAGNRATFLLDRFSFAESAANQLTQAQGLAGSSQGITNPVTPSQTGSTSGTSLFGIDPPGSTSTIFGSATTTTASVSGGEFRWLLNDDELRAWLLDNAFVKGTDVNQPQRVSRFLTGDVSIFPAVGQDQVAKQLTKDNDERAALRSYFRTGIVPNLADQPVPAVDLSAMAGQIGLRSRSQFESIFRADAPYAAFESIGRLQLNQALSGDSRAAAENSTRAFADRATLGTNLDALSTATQRLANQTEDETVRGRLDQSLSTIATLKQRIDSSSLLGREATPTEWTTELISLLQIQQVAATLDELPGSAYRDYALALSQLINGHSGQAVYALADSLSVGTPYSQGIARALGAVIDGRQSPMTALRDVGAQVIGQTLGGSAEAGLLYSALDALTGDDGTQRPTQAQIKQTLTSFAREHAVELADAADELGLQTYGYDLDGRPLVLSNPTPEERVTALSQSLTGLLARGSGSPSGLQSGAQELDQAFGLVGYEIDNRSGFWGMISEDTGQAIDAVVNQALQDQKAFELLTGQLNLDLGKDERGDKFLAALTRYGLEVSGIPLSAEKLLHPDRLTGDDAIGLIEWTTGQSLGDAVRSLDIPLVGDFVADQNALKAFVSGQIFDGSSAFWQNQQYLPHLETIAGQVGVPASAIRALFDKNLTGDQREAAWQGTFQEFLQGQLSTDRINEVFGLEGTDFAFAGDTLTGIIGTLLSGGDTNGAITQLGTQALDSYANANFGFPISWIFNDGAGIEDKTRIGMQILTQATGLNPELGSLAELAYQTFFVDGGFNTSTPEGRAQLGSLVGALGSAAGVPGEYISLAASALNGDLGTSLMTFAGQNFIDSQLQAFGVDASFQEIGQALGLFGNDDLREQAYNETLSLVGGDVSDEAVQQLIIDRTELRFEQLVGEQRANVQYKLGDALINKTLGDNVANGLTKALMTGDTNGQLAAFGGLLTNIAGSENAELIFGAKDIVESIANGTPLSGSSLAAADSWLAQATGWDVPGGTFSAVLDFAQTGSPQQFLNLAQGYAGQLSGYLDGALGLPQGTSQLAYQAFQQFQSAQQAVDLATSNLLNISGGLDSLDFASGQIAQAQEALNLAQTQLQFTTAAIVTTAINLVFGKQIAGIEQALGLPSGTVSLLVTTAVTALLVPGIAFATLAATVLLPGIGGILLAGLLGGGLFGGKKITKKVVLWSYHVSDPRHRPEDTEEKPVLKPKEEPDRTDWPEEAWFPDPQDPGESATNPNILYPGKDIALLDPETLPVQIFLGDTKQQFQAGAQVAANVKIVELLKDLFTLDQRFTTPEGEPDEAMLPGQIWTHKKEHALEAERQLSHLLDVKADAGAIGEYDELIENGSYRRGIGFDDKLSLLVRWVHWQY